MRVPGCLAVAEGIIQWVTRNLVRFASRSTVSFASSSGSDSHVRRGLLLPRELDERLGLNALIERQLIDPRTGRNSQFPLADLLRQSIYSRLAEYEDTNDAERLAEDPMFRMLAS